MGLFLLFCSVFTLPEFSFYLFYLGRSLDEALYCIEINFE